MLIDWFTVAAQAVNFLILVWLLKRFLYKPILAAIDEREKRIATQLLEAENKKAEAEKEQLALQKKNEDFEKQRATLLLDAKTAAEAERTRLLEAARKAAGDLRAKLQKAIEGEAENLKKQIGNLVQREVFSIGRRALSDLAGLSLEERIISAFIQKVRAMPQGHKDGLKGGSHESSGSAIVRSAFELTLEQKQAVLDVVRPLFHEGADIHFESQPDLIGGIELVANGQKLEWSLSGYLTALSDSVTGLLETPSAHAA